MKRFLIAVLLCIAVFGIVIVFNHTQLNPSENIEMQFIPVIETAPVTTNPDPDGLLNPGGVGPMKEIVSQSIKDISFVEFEKEHVILSEPILQFPDYPTGCEIVSLTMALRYVTKTEVSTDDLIDNYLSYHENDYTVGFVGNPRSESGAGCFPPVITKCANSYFRQNGYTFKAMDVTGSTIEDLFYYIDKGLPIVIWGTMYMKAPGYAPYSVTHDGRAYRWYFPEHCLLLKGYNDERNVFILNDPLQGEIEVDMDLFEKIFNTIGNLAIIFA